MHWKKEGESIFAAYGENAIHDKVPAIIIDALDCMSCDLTPGQPFVFADYGTADGKTVLRNTPFLIEHIRQRHGSFREISIQLNYVISNDFKSVWKNVAELQDPDRIYFSTVARSFYQQCLPSNTVHLGISVAAAHWMNKLNFSLEDSLFPNATKKQAIKEKVKIIANNEWEIFLASRAKELVPGGAFICALLGGGDKDVSEMWSKTMMRPMDVAWSDLYRTGLLSKKEKDRAVIPEYFRSEEEHKKPFSDPDSLVYKSGLELVSFGEFRATTLREYRHRYLGKITPENIEEINKKVSARRSAIYKVLFYPHLCDALDPSRKGADKVALLEKYFDDVTQQLIKDTSLLEFPKLSFHILVMRKKK